MITNLNASNTWALEIRGIISIAKAVDLLAANASTMGLFWLGYKKEITVLPSFTLSVSFPSSGGRTLRRISEDDRSSSLSTRVAPACLYCSSRNCARAPAFFSTNTREKPFLRSNAAFWGVRATRASLGKTSRGTPTVNEE